MALRYLYSYQDHHPVYYQDGQYLYTMEGAAAHWIDRQYGYNYDTHQPSLWFDGKYVYGMRSNSTLTDQTPLFYYAD